MSGGECRFESAFLDYFVEKALDSLSTFAQSISKIAKYDKSLSEVDMNITQLNYLITAVDTGSFAHAAEVCHVVPQAVSKGIRSLEQELDVVLFTRTATGVEPTAEAREIAVRARQALDDLADLPGSDGNCSADEQLDLD